VTIDVGVEIRELAGREVLTLKRPLAEIWPDASRARIDEILPRHAERDGFRFLGAFAGRLLVGFVYGYRGEAGQWWHDRVASELGPRGTERWLLPGHLEFTELHVRREYRRRGIGGALHDSLLDGVEAPTAVLSTQTDNEPAIALYTGRGWQVIVPHLDFGSGRAFLIMGKDLAADG
jgi:ribosomal protein S18 acetylase RimI-like enzyme